MLPSPARLGRAGEKPAVTARRCGKENRTMPSAAERLTQLQEELNQTNEPDWGVEDIRRVFFSEVGGLLHIHYYGTADENFNWNAQTNRVEYRLPIFEVLSLPEVASRVASLTFDGPDEGANGSRDW